MKNPKILYLSAHSIHEFEDYRLFLELGAEVYCLDSAYTDPHNPCDDARPPILEGRCYPNLYKMQEASRDAEGKVDKGDVAEGLIEWCDIVYVQHKGPEWIPRNWEKVKKHGKKLLWRGAGQSVRSVEEALKPCRDDGMLIVRYSPREKLIPGYIGEDAMIRFYKDPDEWGSWNGRKRQVITLCQDIKRRGRACNWDSFKESTKGFPRKVYGIKNANLGKLWGGKLSYDDLRRMFRDNRVYFYVGTMPAPYVLNFIEAWMTGIPIVSIGPGLGNPPFAPEQKTFEIQDLIENGINGFVSDDIDELRGYISNLLNDYSLAKNIGMLGRKSAIELFSKQKIKQEWKEFFDGL